MRFNYEDKYYVAVEIGSETFTYVFTEQTAPQIRMCILRDAANPDLKLSKYLARILIERIKDVQEEIEYSEADNEPYGGNERDQQRY